MELAHATRANTLAAFQRRTASNPCLVRHRTAARSLQGNTSKETPKAMSATITHVLGARPNFMKAAPVIAALAELGHEQRIVHTGQHYDERMSDVFFVQLGLPRPDVNLGVGSGSHAQQTAEIMTGMEREFTANSPALAVVYGDVNSTLGAAVAGAKLGIPLAHVEAGLRSFDDSMPEEINRRLTDQLCALLFATSPE